ncbi:MAG: 2-hydroxyglutaryl-CoA dehydratase [Deltaproteobacteria bacterium]|nr:2-hydroxyglutaryl-CoA dehydratase [Deltaproteobacteria bacterium]MBI2347346.1 2-hydroxyglutaryl-CoA dehydratase [Deltaproteobacteria bacterium]
MDFVAGIDIGAKSTKVVILDANKELRGKIAIKTRPDFTAVAKEALDLALQKAGLKEKELSYIATTGFGRYNVPFRDVQITEITCVARGAAFLFPKTHCVLDIGAQSTRAIRVHDGGKVREFRTNDKCAAGAGGFIERAAKYLEVKVEEVGELSIKADKPETISSVCAVLAESEIINHVSSGGTVENIIRGVHISLASRALALIKRAGLEDEVTFVGGVARQKGMVKALEDTLKRKVNVDAEPEMAGALGAALLALRRLEKIRQNGHEPAMKQEARVA